MALTLQPPPRGSNFSRVWMQWFDSLSRLLNTASIPWDAIDFAQSDHADIVTAQGGTTGQRYHLTAAEYSELQRADNVASVSTDTTLTDNHRNVIVTASAKTITLPPASAARLGQDWTVILGTDGYVTVVPGGADTLLLDENSIVLDEEGANVTLRCITTSSWAIA